MIKRETLEILFCFLILFGIGCTNTIGGVALRASLAVVPHWLGLISADALEAFVMFK
ncbi:hypothetical protein [Pseudodesulfovibrio pelocollis]|uniref:hypothetical protein n=1 Tax=Pseudodesulfovibrio pelocollis TaxID=3051432 RepID=UPI00255B32A9|nr:hypothetical protein [Pseudodesulfovibrio sp. SB368]